MGRFGYGTIEQLAYSPDGVRVAVVGRGGVTIWDTEKETVEQVLEGHTELVGSVAWSPDGTQLASGSLDRTVRVWSAEDGRLVHTLTGHTESVVSVAWWPFGCHLASGSGDGTVRRRGTGARMTRPGGAGSQAPRRLWSLLKYWRATEA